MTDTYGLHPDFEEIILYLCATDRRFWASVGTSLEPDLFSNPLARPVIECVRLITAGGGVHPSSIVIVLQRLQAKVFEGKLYQTTLDQVCDMLEAQLDHALPSTEAVLNELVPVVRQRINQLAILSATDDYAKLREPAKARALLDQAHRLGSTALTGERFEVGVGSFTTIAQANTVMRLPTGIMPLDVSLNGGLDLGGLGVYMGGAGGGKSIGLVHGCCEALRNGMFVGFCTLELPPRMQLARIMANLTGIDTDLIYLNDHWRSEAEKRFASVAHVLGKCSLGEFAPHATTVANIIEWVDDEENIRGAKMVALYIDYADKMHSPGTRADNEYLAMRHVYEGLRRDIAVARDMWVWTASQVSRPSKESAKRIDLNHVADSMHKVRVADLVISLNNDDLLHATTYFVAKNRAGKSRFDVGPLTTDHQRARSMTLASELGAW